MSRKKLTPKQDKFVNEYLIDLNGTAAVIRAGFSPKQASSKAYQLLRKNTVQEALIERRKELSAASGVTPEKVIQGFANLAFADLAECYDENGFLKNIHNIPKNIRMALAGIEVDELFEGKGEDRERIGQTKKVKIWDKNRALDSLAKYFGLYAPQVIEIMERHTEFKQVIFGFFAQEQVPADIKRMFLEYIEKSTDK